MTLTYTQQAHLPLSLYTQDSDDVLPGADIGFGLTAGWVTYRAYDFALPAPPETFGVVRGSLYPYVKNRQVYVCPSDAACWPTFAAK